jgi:lysophospholipase L1-like esterase
VDAHQLIALCAPRPTFLSYGVPEKGDAKWLDQQGSYMAAVAAGPAFRLLGARDLGVMDDYRVAKMPPVNTGLLEGQLAWRQHDGGHTDGPTWKYFVPWAARLLRYNPGAPPPPIPPDVPAARTDANSLVAHAQLVEKAKKGGIDVYFLGDSIVRRWGATDYPELLAAFRQNFFGWNAANFGWGGDRTQNILWRVLHGELDGVNPKAVVLLAGTNNIGNAGPLEIAAGVRAIVRAVREKAPNAEIVVTGILPRNDRPEAMAVISEVNRELAGMAVPSSKIRYLNINDKLARPDGTLLPGMMNPDKLHPSLAAYQVWADALKPVLTGILGPPAAEDHAPPATGDPSAVRK